MSAASTAGRVPSSWPSSCPSTAVDRRRRRPRQDDDRGHDRLRPPRARRRPVVDRRRCRPAARGKRRDGLGLARRRGRRVRSLDLVAAAGDRRRDECRGRPSRHVRLGGGARALLRGLAGRGPVGRAGVGASLRPTSSWRFRASTTGGTRRRRSQRSSSRARSALRPSVPCRASRGSTAASSSSARARASGSSTTTATIRPRSPRRSRPRACAPAGGSSRCTSRTCTSERDISRASSARRSGSRTARSSPTSSAGATHPGRVSPGSSCSTTSRASVRCGWAPGLEEAAEVALGWARPGDVVVTLGVGEPWRIARAVVAGLEAR